MKYIFLALLFPTFLNAETIRLVYVPSKHSINETEFGHVVRLGRHTLKPTGIQDFRTTILKRDPSLSQKCLECFGDRLNLLARFSERRHLKRPGELVHFITGPHVKDGVFYLGGVANKNTGYSLSSSFNGRDHKIRYRRYAVTILAHEIAHLFYAPHVNTGCNIMNVGILGCVTAGVWPLTWDETSLKTIKEHLL